MNLDWLDILYKVFEVAIIPILGAATIYLVTLINAKKDELLKKTKSETTKKYIEMLDKTIVECVLATNQTYVSELKKQDAFTKEAQLKALEMTADAVLAILSDEAKAYLPTIVGDLNTYILTQIESEVNRLK